MMPRVHGIDKQRRRAPGGGGITNNNNTNNSGMFSLSTPFANFAGRAITAGGAQGGATPNRDAVDNNPKMMASDELSFCTTQPSQDLLLPTTTANNNSNNQVDNNDTAQQQQEEEEEEVMGTQNPNFPTARGAIDVAINKPIIKQQHFDNGSSNDSSRGGVDGGVDRSGGGGGGAMTAMRIIPRQINNNESNAPSLLAETSASSTTTTAAVTTTAVATTIATAAGGGVTTLFPKLAAVPSSNKLATSGIKFGITTTMAKAANAAVCTSNSNNDSNIMNRDKRGDDRGDNNDNDSDNDEDNDDDGMGGFKDGMDDDSTSTPKSHDEEEEDDDDDEQSIDLLKDDRGSNNPPPFHSGTGSYKNNSSNNNNNNRSSNNRSSSNSSSSSSNSPMLSPATQTLDRLSMIGSQDDGVELCVNLNVNAVDNDNEDLLMRGMNMNMKEGDEKGNFHQQQKREGTSSSSNAATAAAVEPNKAPAVASELLKSHVSPAERAKARRTLSPTNTVVTTKLKENKLPPAPAVGKVGPTTTTAITTMPTTSTISTTTNTTSKPPTNKESIQNFKQYFMSTQNSSEYASNKLQSGSLAPPRVPFCYKCNANNNNTNNNNNNKSVLSQLPHHGLCPQHEDFYISGSYEILNLIVDGNLLGCDACIYHFTNGRPNKALDHLENCKRCKRKSKGGGGSGRKASGLSQASMTMSQVTKETGSRNDDNHASTDRSGQNCQESNNNDGRQDSPELSDYEKLRLRNIQRNEARLTELGLLVPSKNNNKKSANKKNNKEGFLSRNDDGSKKGKKKKQISQEVQKRTLPKRHASKKNADDNRGQGGSVTTDKENASNPNPIQSTANGDTLLVNNSNPGAVSAATKKKTKSSAPFLPPAGSSSLIEAAKAGCRKCTLEWQTERRDPNQSHDACCPRWNNNANSSSRLVNSTQQLKAAGAKKTSNSRTPPPPAAAEKSSMMTLKEPSQVTPRLSPALQDARNIDISQIGHSGEDTSLFQSALNKGFSAAFLRDKTDEELRALLSSHSNNSSRESQTTLQNLPPFIQAFIAEADRNRSEIPAPRGTKWLPCPNPWGKIGHEEGDFVVISPFQSESASDMVAAYHQGPNGSIPKRFVANPLEEGSPYHETHRSPARGGYSVLRLTRDRMGLRPWGFTVRLHEFGGACLVDSIEPLSSAEAAEDISGWSNENIPAGLQLHDMVICVNGKSVGCMTETELQIEFDVCGSEMMLVVARFDIEGNTKQEMTLEDLAMDWNDIGAGAPSRKKVVCFEDEESVEHLNEWNRQSNNIRTIAFSQLDQSAVSHDQNACQDIVSRKVHVTTLSQSNHLPVGHESDDDRDESDDEDDDEEGDNSSSLNFTQRLALEFEPKSDEELMEILSEANRQGNWNHLKHFKLATLLAKRAFIAAAKDKDFQKLSETSKGVTRKQVLEWVNESETFNAYQQIMSARWSNFDDKMGLALKAAGYKKISNGGGNIFSRYALPEDILPQNQHDRNFCLSQEYLSDEDNYSENERDDGNDVSSLNLTQRVANEFEMKSDEELMDMLSEANRPGNWNHKKHSKLATLLAKRAFIAAAKDGVIQKLSETSKGVTKAQVLEWMNGSKIFNGYQQIMGARWSQIDVRMGTALKDAGYKRISGGGRSGGSVRYALPEDIVPRPTYHQNNCLSAEYESEEDDSVRRETIHKNDTKQCAMKGVGGESDSEYEEIEKDVADHTKDSPFQSNSDEDLIQMLGESIESKGWSQIAKEVVERAVLAAARDETIQASYVESGGVTKTQIMDWVNGSNTFNQYSQIVRKRWSESSCESRFVDALKAVGYIFTRVDNTWSLPESVVSRNKISRLQSAKFKGKRKRKSNTFTERKKQYNQYFDSEDEDEGLSHSSVEAENEDDDNPWLGCVCGRTHPFPIEVFWIQCSACDAWHNVAADCVGFTEEAADSMSEWCCWSCHPPVAGMGL